MCVCGSCLVLVFGAKVLWSLPAGSGQVEDGRGSHVCSLGIVGVVMDAGRAFTIGALQAGTWGGRSREWRFGCGETGDY